MKRNKTILPVLLVLLLSGLTFWIVTNKGKSKGTLDENAMNFAVEDTAAVSKIVLADKAGKSITLTRQGKQWSVNGTHTARPDAVKLLLGTIKTIAVKSPVGVKAKENIIKWMATGATKVEIYQGDELVRVYYVGGETQDQLGTYMLLSDPETGENAESPFVMEIPGFTGYLSTRYFTNEAEWRDRTVFRHSPPEIRSIRVEHRDRPELGFQLDLQDAYTFSLKSLSGAPLPLDTLKAKQYVTYYGAVGFEVIENRIQAAKKDSIIATPPAHIITLTDTKGKVNRIKMFLKQGDGEPRDSTQKIYIDPDRMYALINNDKDFVLVQYFVFGKLLQTPEYFLPGKPGAQPQKPQAAAQAPRGKG